jgi:transposase
MVTKLCDFQAIEATYSNRGSKHCPVDCLLRLALYEILDGRPSPAQWARDMQTNAVVKYLVRSNRATKSSLYRFRDKAKAYVDDLHRQLVHVAIDHGLITGEHAAIDGTFHSALSSRHRMINEETLTRRTEKLIDAVNKDHQETPQEQVATPHPRWMASTPDGRQEQLDRYRQAKVVLDERLNKNQGKYKSEQTDPAKIFVSTSDPKVPIGRDKRKCFRPLWPMQCMTETKTGIILAADIFERVTDVGTIGSMIDLTNSITGKKIVRVYADAGYSFAQDITACKERQVDLIASVMENSFTASNREKKRATESGQAS